jgi:Protein of unknown function (DUF2550)
MSGALAFDAAWLFAGFLILVVLLAAGITLRRFLGVAAYQPDELRWYQVFGFQLRPNRVFTRRALTVLSRRAPDSAEAANLGEGSVVVRCRVAEDDGTVELAMGEAAFTGFLAWLEAAPPGSYLGQAS